MPRFCRVSVRGFLLLSVSVMFPRTETKAATQFVHHMLLAGWEVCIKKNCDQDLLENAFSSARSTNRSQKL